MDQAIVNGPDEGELLQSDDRSYLIKVARPELSFIEYEAGPNYAGASPHYHERHTDAFYVLEGELEFRMGTETVRAGPGTFVSAPPGTPHAFTNPGPNPARFLNIHSPDRGFVELMRAHDRGEKPDPQAFDIWYVDE